MTPPEQASIRTLLIEAAQRCPDRMLASFEDGVTWSRRTALLEAQRAATILYRHGLRQGDRVIVCGDNGRDWIRAWWASALLGAVIVPVNPSLRGQMLADIVRLVEPRLVLVDSAFKQRWADAPCPMMDWTELGAGQHVDIPDVEVKPSDIHAIFFTSGTTGQSKGSLCANVFFWEMASWRQGIPVDETDVFLADLPFYHTGVISSAVYMLATGGRLVVRSRPSLSGYWSLVRRHGITLSMLVGSMVNYLLAQPESEDDRNHSLRTVFVAPLPHEVEQFTRRFGVKHLVTMFGSTEMGSVFINPPSVPLRPPSSGKLREGIDVRLVDENHNDVPVGTAGELLVRPKKPLSMSQGYANLPKETAEAWRGGWFHSGDRLYRDADGYYYFFDRIKDAIRRRGENVSSSEVEREVMSYPGVTEASCIGVPDELGTDQEIKILIIPKPGCSIDFVHLSMFLGERMPHYMVPRFFEIRTELPKTPTGRVRKLALREAGNTSDTWDREAHGIFFGRGGLK